MGNRGIVVLGIIAGFFVVSFAAQYSPQLVNGVLLLILIGTILGHANQWLPLLAQFNTAVKGSLGTPVGATTGGSGGGRKK